MRIQWGDVYKRQGKHLTGTVIYGYLWNEARDLWLVDPEAAEVVKRIFATVSYTHLDVYKRQALYPLMGIEVGTTVHFPMTTQELQAALAKIGIDGKRYSDCLLYTSSGTLYSAGHGR